MSSMRPFRVWDVSRRLKKSLVASSLAELIQKSNKKLEFESNTVLKVVLESDGTVIEDEEYFNLLDDDTTFMVLKDDEKWEPRHKEGGQDEPDFSYKAALGQKPIKDSLLELGRILRQDLSKIVLFTRDQLQTLVDGDESELSQLLGNSTEDAKSIQSACQRYLDEKQQVNDAVQLLKMLKKEEPADQVDGKSPNKRQRTQ